jgi:predicted unusual protein kinase regulating ubiquinone biosynthesis (AarF/ABC1/UbiB family)
VPDEGLVAVKIQYPGALQTMTIDLVNLRATSAFLQKTELKFDLLSAVEELQKQIHLEFDFMRWARGQLARRSHCSSRVGFSTYSTAVVFAALRRSSSLLLFV